MEKTRVAVMGLGRMGLEWHCEALDRLDEFDLVAGCDPTPARLEVATEQFGLRGYETLEEMLADADIDLVIVATPSAMHHDHVIKVLEARKHCLTEKPPAMNVAEWDEMGHAASKAGRTLCCFQNARWNLEQLQAMGLVERGELGEIAAIKLISLSYSDLMHTYGVPEYRPGWRAEKRYGGGRMYDFGPHHIDRVLQILGHARGRDVYADLLTGTWSDNVEDGFLVIIRFENGVTAHIEQNVTARANLNTFMVAGSEATFQDGVVRKGEPGELVEEELEAIDRDADEYYLALHEHLTKGTPPPVPWEHTRQMMRILDAAFESAATGEVVALR